jgi:hypothetical protein
MFQLSAATAATTGGSARRSTGGSGIFQRLKEGHWWANSLLTPPEEPRAGGPTQCSTCERPSSPSSPKAQPTRDRGARSPQPARRPLHAAGRTFGEIARGLTADGVPTATVVADGGRLPYGPSCSAPRATVQGTPEQRVL